MFHSSSISFKGEDFDLTHLRQKIGRFSWTNKETEEEAEFSVRMRFSNHCYTEEIKGARVVREDDVVVEHMPTRVFCPIRHDKTHLLVQIMHGLIERPTTSVALTTRTTGGGKNWTVYKLYSCPDGLGNERYTVFFSVARGFDGLPDGTRGIDVYVESAYLKEQRVSVLKNVPFGRVAEMASNGEQFF